MAGVGRVFQGVEYPSRREACQARHREYVRALADGLNFTQAAHAVGVSKRTGKALMEAEINTLTSMRVPRSLTELITLGRTLTRRATDILPTSTTHTPQADPPKPSTDPSNTYAAAPQDFPKPALRI